VLRKSTFYLLTYLLTYLIIYFASIYVNVASAVEDVAEFTLYKLTIHIDITYTFGLERPRVYLAMCHVTSVN